MKIVIEIPDHVYEHAKNMSEDSNDEYEAMRAIAKGQEEKPHGKWVKGDPWTTGVGMGEQYGYWYTCSECGYKVKGGYTSCDIKFCQECGSDNQGGDTE